MVDRDITLDDYAARWLAQIATEIKPRTLDLYTSNLDRHVLPAFGRFKLRELHRGHLRDFLARKRGAGLGKNSVRLIRAVLSVLLSDAVDDGIILANPALQLRGSRRRRPDSISQAERQKRIRPMDHGQLAAFLAAAQADSGTTRCSCCSRGPGYVLAKLTRSSGATSPSARARSAWSDRSAPAKSRRRRRARRGPWT